MDEYNKELRSYLHTYFTYLRNEKIETDYLTLIRTKKNMGNLLDKCYAKYNGLDQLMNCESDQIYKKIKANMRIQFGGDLSQKIQKLHDLALVYNKIKPDDLTETLKKISTNVDKIINELNGMDASNISPDKFINDLETVTSEMNNTFKIQTTRNKLYLAPRMITPTKDSDVTSIETALDNIEKEIDQLQKTISESDKKTEDETKKIYLQISELRDKLTKIDSNQFKIKIDQIKSHRLTLKKNLEEVNKNLDTPDSSFSKNDLKLFRSFKTMKYLVEKNTNKYQPFNNFFNEIKDIKSNEIQIQKFNNFLKTDAKKLSPDIIKEIVPNPDGIYPDFTGEFTYKITQNMIQSENTNSNINAITKLLIIPNEPIQFTEETLKEIYVPDLTRYAKTNNQQVATKMLGGTIDDINTGISNLMNDREKIKNELGAYSNEFNNYILEVKEYNTASYDLYIHTIYLVSIITNKLIGPTSFVVYRFLNKGTLELYRRTLTTIMTKIADDPSAPVNLYLRKYHNRTLQILYNFFTKLSGKMGAKDIIDINNCSDVILDKFIIFNYFKATLDAYKATFQNKVTIYARLNDIGKGFEYNGGKDENGVDTRYESSKMFASDYDRQDMFKADPGIQTREQIETTTEKKKIKEKGIVRDEIITIDHKYDDGPVDTSLMYVRKKACSNIALEGDQKTEALKFTEVFDTLNFQDNEEISKSMLMDTQLTQKKGLGVMTYGYSGTGKTYTLFGKAGEAEGILQATIKNINGLESVKFRLFELFGYGQVYPFYWSQGDTNRNTTNLDKIEHFIIAYNLTIGKPEDGIKFESINGNEIQVIDAENIAAYTEMTTNKKGDKDFSKFPVEFTGTNAGVYLKTFDTFIDNVEKKRIAGHQIQNKNINKDYRAKTVRDTPNNVASSRSVLVYDFRLKIAGSDQFIPFLIIDLPGREDIIGSYIEPYFNDEMIQEMLKIKYGSNFNDMLIFLKSMTSTMALNPMALPLFQMTPTGDNLDFINSTFNQLDNNAKKQVINEEIKLFSVTEQTKAQGGKEAYLTYFNEIVNKNGITLNNFADSKQSPNVVNSSIGGKGYKGAKQSELICSIHLINRLALTKRYDVIETIYEKFCDHFVNNIFKKDNIIKYQSGNEVTSTSTKLGKFMMGSLQIDKNIENIKKMKGGLFKDLIGKEGVKDDKDTSSFDAIYKKIKEIKNNDEQSMIETMKNIYEKLFVYDYYLTPLEGIYINENIIGLIKFLADKLTDGLSEDKRKLFLDKNIPKQDSSLSFFTKQQEVRYMLSTPSKAIEAAEFVNLGVTINIKAPPYDLTTPANTTFPYFNDDFTFNYDVLRHEYESKTKKLYKSSNIYNFDKPIITDILLPYLEVKDLSDPIKTAKINETKLKDYKVFYLFGNYSNDEIRKLKCQHQYSLLENTKSFIETITST